VGPPRWVGKALSKRLRGGGPQWREVGERETLGRMARPLLLGCESVGKAYGTRRLFDDLSFGLFEGDRAGLVGPMLPNIEKCGILDRRRQAVGLGWVVMGTGEPPGRPWSPWCSTCRA